MLGPPSVLWQVAVESQTQGREDLLCSLLVLKKLYNDKEGSKLTGFIQNMGLSPIHVHFFSEQGVRLLLIDYIKSFMAHQHQKGHTVPKQVRPLDDDDDITVH